MGLNIAFSSSTDTKAWSSFSTVVSNAVRGADDETSKRIRNAAEKGDGDSVERELRNAAGEPDPSKFEVKRVETFGSACVAEVIYPTAENYEGRKIMVWDDLEAFEACQTAKALDPHFLEHRPSPIARFEPTDLGWGLAVACAKSLGD